MSQETWRDTEYPNYQVSNLGRVRKFNHILSGAHPPNGYVHLYCIGERKTVGLLMI